MVSPRVAVYIDFDNVVISRYDQVHSGTRDAWRRDNARDHTPDPQGDDPIDVKLAEATLDIGAVLDYASSFGTVALSRAYADWSVPANAAYRRQLVDRAVDLTQLFPVSGTKNGADIRLAVDAIEDLMQYSDLTHVVIVGGDSDYVALAQRCKQLGRFVVGIGVKGSTGRALIAACDEFRTYDAIPGVPDLPKKEPAAEKEAAPEPDKQEPAKKAPAKKTAAKKTAAKKTTQGATKKAAAPEPEPEEVEVEETESETPTVRTTTRRRATRRVTPTVAEPDPQQEGTSLLLRALRIAQDKAGEGEWLFGGGVKSQMQRMDPGFKEKELGYKTFSDFVESRIDAVEVNTEHDDGNLRLRLR